jgi:hypothetical protein
MAKTIDSLTALAATPNDTEDFFVVSDNGVTKKISAANLKGDCIRNISGTITIADAANFALNATTGSKLGTDPNQRLGFWNATPVARPAAVANLTVTATSGSLPAANGSVTIANASTPTVAELLEYCVELETKLEDLLGKLRTIGLIAT